MSTLLHPGEEREHPQVSLRTLHLSDSSGRLLPRVEGSSTEPVWLQTASALGFAWSAPHASLREELRSLPTLGKMERGEELDARARLARAIHWLGIADQLDARPPDRLAHAWIAIEHLVAEGFQSKGPLVIRHLVDAAVIEQIPAIAGATIREALAALHLNACARPGKSALVDFLSEASGSDESPRYVAHAMGFLCSRAQLNPSAPVLRISDHEALKLLASWRERLNELAPIIEPESPYAAWRVRSLAKHFETNADLRAWIQHLRLEAAALLQHTYDLRNQLVHDADPFVFEESHRLQDLYLRFRGLIDPLLVSLLHELSGKGPQPPLALLWAEKEARYAELFHRVESTKKLKEPPDMGFLFRCLGIDI